MNSVEFLRALFQLMYDIKHASLVRPDPERDVYVASIILDFEGDDDDE